MAGKRKHYPLRSIFISYNHRHASDIAGRVYDRLAARLSPGAVFKDNEEPELGVDFLDSFKHALSECRIVLVVIDPGWYERRNAPQPLGEGVPPDWVRMEVEYALQKEGLRVIPVLVNGAEAPDGQPLPPSLAGLRRRYHKRIHSDDGFSASVEALIVAIEQALAPVKPKAPWRRFLVPVVASLAILAGLAAWGFFNRAKPVPANAHKVRIETLNLPIPPAPQPPAAAPEPKNRIRVSTTSGWLIEKTPVEVTRDPGIEEWVDSTGQTHQSENFILLPLRFESISAPIPGPLWVNYYVDDSKPAESPQRVEFDPSLRSGLGVVAAHQTFWMQRGFTRVGSWPLLWKPDDPPLTSASDKTPYEMSGAIIFGKEGHIDPGKHVIGIEVITPSPNFETLYQGTMTLEVK